MEPFFYIYTYITYSLTTFGNDPWLLAEEDVSGVGQTSPKNNFVGKIGILKDQFSPGRWDYE